MKHLLEQAKQEIVTLRRRNEVQEAQLAIVEVFAAALGLRRSEHGMGPDVVWQLQQKIDELTANEPADTPEP